MLQQTVLLTTITVPGCPLIRNHLPSSGKHMKYCLICQSSLVILSLRSCTAELTNVTLAQRTLVWKIQERVSAWSRRWVGTAYGLSGWRHDGPDVDWIALSSVLRPRQHSIGYMGDGFYRSEDPTNSIKVLKEQIVHRQLKTYNKQTW